MNTYIMGRSKVPSTRKGSDGVLREGRRKGGGGASGVKEGGGGERGTRINFQNSPC